MVRTVLLGIGLVSVSAEAATPVPDAGQLLQNIKPVVPLAPAAPASALPTPEPAVSTSAPGGTTLTVSAFHISGATAFPESTLQALLADAVGKPLTLGEVKARIERITDYYRSRGYLLARAYLPPQQISGGNVEIRVLEGQLGHLGLQNHSLVANAAVLRQLQQLPEGKPVQAGALDRDLLLLNELPGAIVHSTLKPGEAVGSTDLDVAVAATPRAGGSLQYDNDGNRYTGGNRLTGALHINSPTGQGDIINLQTQLARGIEYERLGYQIPVGGYGTQLGTGASLLDYKLGGDFKDLHAHGSAADYSLLALQPLWRERTGSLDAEATFDHKRLDDTQNLGTSETLKGINSLGLALSGQQQGRQGASSGSLTLTDGHVNALDSQAGHSADHYDKLALQFSRQQLLGDRFSLSAAVSGQAANKNLDSTEKMSLGGAAGVRAYAPGESSSDEALLARLELRYAFSGEWQAGTFADAARGLLEKHPTANDPVNGRNLAGEGLSLYWSRRAIALQAYAAWRDGDAPTTPERGRARVGVQLNVYF